MADAVDVRVLHRRENTLGRVAVEAEWSDAITQSRPASVVVGHVERAVGADVDLDPLQDPERLQPLVERVDLLVLRLEPAVAQVVRVVGDGVVLVAARRARRDHLLERVLRPSDQVVWECRSPLDVAELDELRQLALARGLELAAVLAQLGRDELVAEVLVELLLVLELSTSSDSTSVIAVLGDRETVLSRRSSRSATLCVLRAGEVLEQVPVRLRRHDA